MTSCPIISIVSELRHAHCCVSSYQSNSWSSASTTRVGGQIQNDAIYWVATFTLVTIVRTLVLSVQHELGVRIVRTLVPDEVAQWYHMCRKKCKQTSWISNNGLMEALFQRNYSAYPVYFNNWCINYNPILDNRTRLTLYKLRFTKSNFCIPYMYLTSQYLMFAVEERGEII